MLCSCSLRLRRSATRRKVEECGSGYILRGFRGGGLFETSFLGTVDVAYGRYRLS